MEAEREGRPAFEREGGGLYLLSKGAHWVLADTLEAAASLQHRRPSPTFEFTLRVLQSVSDCSSS